MNKNKKVEYILGASLVISMLIISAASGALGIFSINAMANELTVDTDEDQYYPEELVIITGQYTEDSVGTQAQVCVNVTDPDGAPVFWICVDSDSEGNYNTDFTLSEDTKSGTYNVHAYVTGEETVEAFTTFEVIREHEITVETDQSEYNPGDSVVITGQYTENGTGTQEIFCLNCTNPSQEEIYGACAETNPDGTFSGGFTLESDAETGTYTVNAYVEIDGGEKVKSFTTFQVVSDIICGDANGMGGVDIDDVVYLISYIFSGGPAPVPGCCD